MSRFDDDGGDNYFPGQYELWEANVTRAFSGQRGQQALRDLRTALLELSEKRLISGHLAQDGEVCAIGALVTYRRVTKGEQRELILADLEGRAPALCATCGHPKAEHDGDYCGGCVQSARWYEEARVRRADPAPIAVGPPTLCTEFVDSGESEDYGLETTTAGQQVGLTYTLAWEIAYMNDEKFAKLTPEERYERTLEWVDSCILEEAA